ncbi:MAG: C-GCAxxG-C-C family protein [Fibrobacter sp.]|nr:C-GCAxxG-C-C family protein [Fibrobacter sp.]
MTHKEKALAYFKNNFNCSQAVFTTFATEMGFDEELALKLSTQFGGGARCGQLCGAVSGALMVLGLKYGHCHPENSEEKSRAYEIAVEFNKRFIEKNGSVVCKKLLGYDVSDPGDSSLIKEKRLFKTTCPQMITDAVEILDKMLSENTETPAAQA